VRGGKLIRMYKRPGHRVIINADGDLIVRPMFVEVCADAKRFCHLKSCCFVGDMYRKSFRYSF